MVSHLLHTSVPYTYVLLKKAREKKTQVGTQGEASLLWMSICSLDFVTVVVFEVAVVLVPDETVGACIFSNNLQRQKKPTTL